MKKKTIQKPNIKKQLRMFDESLLEEDYIENCLCSKEIEDIFFDEKEMIGCRFENVTFRENALHKVDFVDCEFVHCDLSNLDLSKRSIHRVTFDHCKLVGTDFSNASLQDVRFLTCNASYANFAEADLFDSLFHLSSLRAVSFQNIAFKNLVLQECELSESEWHHTSLNGLDLRENRIEGARFTKEQLKGVIVTSEQGLELLNLLGIVVLDEERKMNLD